MKSSQNYKNQSKDDKYLLIYILKNDTNNSYQNVLIIEYLNYLSIKINLNPFFLWKKLKM